MDDEVWSSFDRSVAYMREVAALYESAFGGRAEPRKAVSKAHLDEAHNQAQQALELLASNLLNASMTVINAVETQESEADSLAQKMATVRRTIRERQAALDQQAICKFYAAHKGGTARASRSAASARTASPQEDQKPRHQLKLSLAPEQCMQ